MDLRDGPLLQKADAAGFELVVCRIDYFILLLLLEMCLHSS